MEAVAQVMAQTVLTNGCVVQEPDCEVKTVLALVAVDLHESGFAADVQDCTRCVLGGPWCDHGRAQTAYQMQYNNWGGHSKAAICKDFSLATTLAWKALNKPKAGWKGKFLTYAGRSGSGRELLNTHQTLILRWTKKSGS